MASKSLWPGFDPRRIPIALFDGKRTWLFHRAAPPEGFVPVPGWNAVAVLEGRHPALTANTAVDLGGVRTATVLLAAGDGASLHELAALVIHECFHAFQDAHHPGWTANEAALFGYPFDDGQVLTLRHLETAALRRALLAADADDAANWAAAALAARRARYARLPAGAVTYERGTELHEGLASYVEGEALGRPHAEVLPASGFPAEEVRRRAYRTGEALAVLLDRFDPAWKTELETGYARGLDELLLAALARAGAQAEDFGETEREDAWQRAADDIAALARRRDEARASFLGLKGWRIVVVCAGAPLMPAGFDPLNVTVLGGGEVLHTRWLKLASGAGTVEILGHESLTSAAGEDPLFSGVARLTVAGLTQEPVESSGGAPTISAPGLSVSLAGARVEHSGQTLTVTLPR